MSTGLHLSRVRLRRDADIRALAPMLVPDDADARLAAGHRLAWSLFAGDPAARRDFLWREEEPGQLIVLSPRPPISGGGLLDIETRPFADLPERGGRFAFALRANPTVSVARAGRDDNGKFRRGKVEDVIMQALHSTPGRRGSTGRMLRPLRSGQGRAFVREALLGWLDGEVEGADVRRPALDWLVRQGGSRGFEIDRAATRVTSYRCVQLPRRNATSAAFGQVDFEGILTVTDAVEFQRTLREGIGRARAFGCGLFLLARLPSSG